MKFLAYLFLLCLTLSSTCAFAQLEFAPIGAKWYINEDYCRIDEPSRFDEFEIIACTGDTLISDKLCKVVGDDIVYRPIYDFLPKRISFEFLQSQIIRFGLCLTDCCYLKGGRD